MVKSTFLHIMLISCRSMDNVSTSGLQTNYVECVVFLIRLWNNVPCARLAPVSLTVCRSVPVLVVVCTKEMFRGSHCAQIVEMKLSLVSVTHQSTSQCRAFQPVTKRMPLLAPLVNVIRMISTLIGIAYKLTAGLR